MVAKTPDEINAIAAQLKEHEDEVLHAYPDSLGYLTLGIGRCVDPLVGGGISIDESRFLFGNDLRNRMADLDERLPWWSRLDPIRQRVLVDMCFQLGIKKLLTFRNTLGSIFLATTVESPQKEVYFAKAADEMLISYPWAHQAPNRVKRLSMMMRDGKEVAKWW